MKMARFPQNHKAHLSASEQLHKQMFQQRMQEIPVEELLNEKMSERQKHELYHYEVFPIVPWGPETTMKQKTPLRINYHDRYLLVCSHAHSWLEMLCVVSGTCAHRVGRFYGQLKTGDVLVISPGTTHSFLPLGDDCIIYNLYFKIEEFEADFPDVLHGTGVLSTFLLKTLYADSENSYLIFHTGNYFSGDNALAALVEHWFHPRQHLGERLRSYSQLFFLDLLDVQAQPPTVSIDLISKPKHQRILTEYIHAHATNVTVQELSNVFNYSPRQIARIFRKATGMSCTEYIQKCRQETFLSLLVGSDVNISQAMEISGIKSPSAFYAAFRQQYGKSPAEYRQEHRNIIETP